MTCTGSLKRILEVSILTEAVESWREDEADIAWVMSGELVWLLGM